jgi:hypothetical protein
MCCVPHPKVFDKYRLYLVVLENENLRFDLLGQFRFDQHQTREIVSSAETEILLS